MRTLSIGTAAFVFVSLGSTLATAQPILTPLTYRAALELAAARNLGLEAARRQRAIREANIKAAAQIDNPSVLFETSRDTPHEILSVEMPIGFGLRRSRRIELANEELTLADLDVRIEMRTLRRNLRDAYYGLLAADDYVRLAEEVLAAAERGKQVAQARFDEGAAPRLDVMAAELGEARAGSELDLARSARMKTQADLNAVLNQPPATPVVLADKLSDLPPVPDFETAMALASTSNVDLVTAERELAVEARRTGLLRADRWPIPTLSFGGVFNAPGEFKTGAQGGVIVALPLFRRNQGEIAASLATSSQIQAKRDAVRRTVENQLYGATSQIDARRRQVETYGQTLYPTAMAILGLAEESYRLGRTSVLALLEAQRSFRDISREYLQLQLELETAIADFEEIIGAPIQ